MSSLDRLNIHMPMVREDRAPTQQFQLLWQRMCEAIEAREAYEHFLALKLSYTRGLTVTASDAGTTATITLGAHQREYADDTSVSVNGGTVTGLTGFASLYHVYYDDADRAGGTVTYAATSVFTSAIPSPANPDRHYVGSVTTPADGGANTTGTTCRPIGYATDL